MMHGVHSGYPPGYPPYLARPTPSTNSLEQPGPSGNVSMMYAGSLPNGGQPTLLPPHPSCVSVVAFSLVAVFARVNADFVWFLFCCAWRKGLQLKCVAFGTSVLL